MFPPAVLPKSTINDISQSLHEHRYLQNQSYSRDCLPSAISIKQYYVQLKESKSNLDFDEVGVSVFSQNNEDGILLFIFSVIGMYSKRCIEIGCDLTGSTIGVPEGNSINLIANFNYDGLIIDIDPAKIGAIRHYFSQSLTTKHFHRPEHQEMPASYYSPVLVAQQVTSENVNDIFVAAGFTGDIDLLSIDVDGADLSIWKSVSVIKPRVVVLEINSRLPFDVVVIAGMTPASASVETFEYQSSFGSSLAAACIVAAESEYVFVGMNSTLINAFFIRKDVWNPRLCERKSSDYVGHRMSIFKK